MLEKPVYRTPAISCIARFEERCRLDSAIEQVRIGGWTWRHLPDLSERETRVLGEADAVLVRLAPCFSKVFTRAERPAPMRTRWSSECAVAPLSSVVEKRVNRFTTEMRPFYVPVLSGCVRSVEECALHRTDQKKNFFFACSVFHLVSVIS